MLMDMVYNLIPDSKKKLRIHFNKFMLGVHQNIHEIKKLDQHKYDDPISVLSESLINKYFLLFFDEFQVTDIADAMLMSRLFTALFERGMIVFFTSNRVPNDLYKNGLQRELFLPFINRIHDCCNVICLDSSVDYRRILNASYNRVYFNCDYENHLVDNLVRKLIREQDSNPETAVDELTKLTKLEIYIFGRRVLLNKTYKRLLDTTYSFICEDARSSLDYLELCKLFDVVVMRDIPFIDMSNGDSLRRFIIFVDTLYDNNIKLIFSGKSSSPEYLFNISNYKNKEKSANSWLHEEYFAIDRTISRLIDMQSEKYLNKASQLNQNI